MLRDSVACGKTVCLIIISMCFLMRMSNYFDMSVFLQACPNPGKVEFPTPKASRRHGLDQANGEIYARMTRDHSRPRYVWCLVVLRNELRAEIAVQCVFIGIDVANE